MSDDQIHARPRLSQGYAGARMFSFEILNFRPGVGGRWFDGVEYKHETSSGFCWA